MSKAKLKHPLKIIAGAPDKPLAIGDIEIPCYVLEDETRVLSQRGLTAGIGLNPDAGFRMPQFLASKAIKQFVSNEIAPALEAPVLFQNPAGGGNAYGYPAEVIEHIIDAVMDAEQAGALHDKYASVVVRARALNRGLRRVGIIALVDEATGYQRIRGERALADILERFIAKELQPWTKTFPIEFYEGICKLKGWPNLYSVKRPSVVGHYTNDFIYDRLAPGVLDELKRKNPKLPSGRRGSKHHQWFTPDLGHPKLKEHLAAVMALMRAAPNWENFTRSLQRAYPKLNETIPMPLDEKHHHAKNLPCSPSTNNPVGLP